MRNTHTLTTLGLGLALASLAGASTFKSDPSLDLTVTGQNLQLANVYAGISDNGARLSMDMGQDGSGTGNKDIFVVATLNTYVTVGGGVGSGTMLYGVSFADCDATPFAALGTCSTQVSAPTAFTFGVSGIITQKIALGISGFQPFGSATAGIGQAVFFSVRDSDGNLIDSPTFTYSTVANPEPGTWVLMLTGTALLLMSRRKKSGAPGERCPARVSSR